MATERRRDANPEPTQATNVSSPVESLLLAAMQRGDDSLHTGRYLVTLKEGAAEAGIKALESRGMRVADNRDLQDSPSFEAAGDADAVSFPEIGVALVGGPAAEAQGMSVQSEIAPDSPVESIDPEYFVFAASVLESLANENVGDFEGNGHTSPRLRGLRVSEALGGRTRTPTRSEQAGRSAYLRGFMRAAEALIEDIQIDADAALEEPESLVLGATWGLGACRVTQSTRNGAGIKVAILDTGMDLGHPDFGSRPIVSQTFVGQPVQDLNGHGTHCMGTACGPQSPPGATPRYGIGYRASMFVGKVLTNGGSGTQAGVLAGMNWAIAQRCPVISMSLGAPIGVQPSYTAAGRAALSHGLLIVAASGNESSNTGAPANSPTILSVASLDQNLQPSSFSNSGKVEIAAPGRDVFSSWLRPLRYRTISGTSMATPHVAGCAALWAQTSPSLRGIALWRKLVATARRLPFPASRVGAGLVQAP